jgi:hypothetical protein
MPNREIIPKMNTTKLLKKSPNNTDYKSDIINAYTILSKKDKLYHITLEGISTPHIQDLYFQLTNKLFNTIHKDYKHTFEFLNYLFVIEYGGVISKKKLFDSYIQDLGIHAHCIINTSLTMDQINFYLNTCFKKIPDIKIQNISKGNEKEGLLNYLLKQDETGLMTSDSYNYKILP